MGAAANTVKRRIFWRHGVVGGRGGGPSLLWRGEKAFGKDTASSGRIYSKRS